MGTFFYLRDRREGWDASSWFDADQVLAILDGLGVGFDNFMEITDSEARGAARVLREALADGCIVASVSGCDSFGREFVVPVRTLHLRVAVGGEVVSLNEEERRWLGSLVDYLGQVGEGGVD